MFQLIYWSNAEQNVGKVGGKARRHNIQLNDTQPNDVYHNDTQPIDNKH